MAFGAKRIFPIDTRPSIGVGVAIPFNAPAVFKTTYTTQNAIKNNLINFFLTEPGEIYLNPTFGGGLRSFVFEQITNDTTEFLKEDIQAKINKYFPNVIVSNLEVFQNDNSNNLIVSINYSITDTAISDEIEIAFS
jgi:phage baseplate assembly protein W